MRDFDDPPPGALRRVLPLVVDFLSAPFDVGNVAMFFDDAKRRGTRVAGIGAQVLAASLRQCGTRHHDGIEDCFKLADIMSICSGHDDRERDATTVHQQVTLAPLFSPDPSGSVRRIPVRTGPSSSPGAYSAIATQCLRSRRTPPAPLSTALQTRR